MASRDEAVIVLSAHGGDGHPNRDDYLEAGRVLGVPAGQVYLTVTGLPADGGGSYPPQELRRFGALEGSSQHVVYGHVTAGNPTRKEHVHRWILARAETDAQMLAAAARRDAAPGEVLEPEAHEVETVLTRDHDQVVALFEQLKTVPGVTSDGTGVHLSRRESIVDMITVALSRHEAAEEEHFWPAVRSALPDGDERAATALEQEQQGKELLTELGRLAASEEAFDELSQKLEKAARVHVAFEDRVLLALAQVMSDEDRRALGERIRNAERRAPTRPHRHAPKRPGPAVMAAGAPAGALDRARDALGHRPAKRRGKAEQEPEIRERALDELERRGEQRAAPPEQSPRGEHDNEGTMPGREVAK